MSSARGTDPGNAATASSGHRLLRQLATALGKPETYFLDPASAVEFELPSEILQIWQFLDDADRLKLVTFARTLAAGQPSA